MKGFLLFIQLVVIFAVIVSLLMGAAAFLMDQIDAYRWRKDKRSA